MEESNKRCGELLMAENGCADAFFLNWCNLEWTNWVPFSTTSRTLDNVPDTPGLLHPPRRAVP